MAVIYKYEDSAHRRVDWLIRNRGVWPGVIRQGDGSFRLTYDPKDTRETVVVAGAAHGN